MKPQRGRFRLRRQFLFNFGAPLRRAHDDAVRSQLLFVLREVSHPDGTSPEEAMAARRIPRSDTRAGDLHRLAVEHSHDPADGPDESRAVEAGPGHRARPCQIVYRAWQDVGQDLLGSAAALDLLCRQVLALLRADHEYFVERNTLLLGEAHRRACRLADRIVGHGLWRAGHLIDDVRLLAGPVLRPHSYP